MPPIKKTSDKMLQAVLADPDLRKAGGFEDVDCMTVDEALASDNCIIRAVGLIIERSRSRATDAEIYREVNEYLRSNV